MQKLIFKNGAGKEIDLTSGNFGIVNWEGLSNADLNIQTQQVPFEDGAVFLDALIEPREIEVIVAIYDGNDLELRYQKKRELISALNPKLGEGVLIYTNDYLSKQIKAVPQLPFFENKNSNDARTLKASDAFSCPSPYWEDLEVTIIEVNKDEIVNIENNGDISSFPKIEIDGVVTNPIIINQTTGKVIKLDMTTDKNVVISTEVGEKRINTLRTDYEILEGKKYNDAISVNNKTILVGVDICIIDEFGIETHINSPFSQNIVCIEYANGVYIAGTSGGGILRSEDCLKWDVIIELGQYSAVVKLSYVNDIWFACGYTSGPALISYSEDNGKTWNYTGESTFYDNARFVIFYNNNYYIKNGAFLRKTADLNNWTSIEPENLPEDVIEVELNHWIGVTSNGKIVESTNPEVWTVISTPTENSLSKIKKINDKYFGLGYETIVCADDTNLLLWNEISSSIELQENVLCGYFILGNYNFYDYYGSLYKTSDLENWETKKSKDGRFINITKAFNKYIILYVDNDYESYLLESADGVNYESVEIPTSTSGGANGQIFDGQKLIIAFYNKLSITNDGINFVEKDLSMIISKLLYANNKYFITSSSTTFYGDDLDHLEDLGVKVDLITYHNGVYYRITGNKLFSSSDLENWNELFTFPNVATSLDIRDMVIFKNKLIVSTTGYAGVYNATRIFCFYDLSDFTSYKTYYKVHSQVYEFFNENDTTLWCCGDYGEIGTSSDGYIWSFQTTSGILDSLYIDDKKLAIGSVDGGGALLIDIIKTNVIDNHNNLISKLSPSSELNWPLLQGQNSVQFVCEDGVGKIIITFRQKYVGV